MLSPRSSLIRSIEETDSIAILPDLVDSHRGIERIIALKKYYRNTGKKIAIRLDSGDLAGLARYAFGRYQEEGMLDPVLDRIVIADVSSIEKLETIEASLAEIDFIDAKKYVSYGLGGLLVTREKTRDTLSAGYKLTQIGDRATGKISDDVGKEALPGRLNVEERREWRGTHCPTSYNEKRVIVLEEEEKGDDYWESTRLLTTAYDHGKFAYAERDQKRADFLEMLRTHNPQNEYPVAPLSYVECARRRVGRQCRKLIFKDIARVEATTAPNRDELLKRACVGNSVQMSYLEHLAEPTGLSPAVQTLRTRVRAELMAQSEIVRLDDIALCLDPTDVKVLKSMAAKWGLTQEEELRLTMTCVALEGQNPIGDLFMAHCFALKMLGESENGLKNWLRAPQEMLEGNTVLGLLLAGSKDFRKGLDCMEGALGGGWL